MTFPIKVCVVCSEEFELRADSRGFAYRGPACSASAPEEAPAKRPVDAVERKAQAEVDAARRRAMRDLLYRKDR
jgi:hypothetical protein